MEQLSTYRSGLEASIQCWQLWFWGMQVLPMMWGHFLGMHKLSVSTRNRHALILNGAYFEMKSWSTRVDKHREYSLLWTEFRAVQSLLCQAIGNHKSFWLGNIYCTNWVTMLTIICKTLCIDPIPRESHIQPDYGQVKTSYRLPLKLLPSRIKMVKFWKSVGPPQDAGNAPVG